MFLKLLGLWMCSVSKVESARCALAAVETFHNGLFSDHRVGIVDLDTGNLVEPLQGNVAFGFGLPPKAVAFDRETSRVFQYDHTGGHLIKSESCTGDFEFIFQGMTEDIAGLTYDCHSGNIYGTQENGGLIKVDKNGVETQLGSFSGLVDRNAAGLLVSKDGTEFYLLDIDDDANTITIWKRLIAGGVATMEYQTNTIAINDNQHGALTWKTLGDDRIIIFCHCDKCFEKDLDAGGVHSLFFAFNNANIHFDGLELYYTDLPSCTKIGTPCLGRPTPSLCDGYPCERKLIPGEETIFYVETFPGANGINVRENGSPTCSMNEFPTDVVINTDCRFLEADGLIPGVSYYVHVTKANGGGSGVHVVGECDEIPFVLQSGKCYLPLIENSPVSHVTATHPIECIFRAPNGAILHEGSCDFNNDQVPVAIEITTSGIWCEGEVVVTVHCLS